MGDEKMPNIEFLTERRFTLSSHLIKIALDYKLSIIEFLLLIYFEDSTDKTLNVVSICEALSLSENEVLNAFNHLLTLNLVELDTKKDTHNKHCEEISLVPLYKNLFESINQKKEEETKESIFDLFQKELGRNISPMEYEIINAWLEKGFSEELVTSALKEAVYNGVNSLRYIDKILYEWQKKGYKSYKDVEEGLSKKRKEEKPNELFDYNWLEDEE